MFSLENRVVVLFGGNGYLGKHFCKALLEQSCILYNCDLEESKDAAITELAGQYPNN